MRASSETHSWAAVPKRYRNVSTSIEAHGRYAGMFRIGD